MIYLRGPMTWYEWILWLAVPVVMVIVWIKGINDDDDVE